MDKEKQIAEIIKVVRKKLEEGITGKVILNINDGKLCSVNFDYSIKNKELNTN